MQNGPLHAPLESLVLTFANSLQQIWGPNGHNTIPFFYDPNSILRPYM